MSEDLAQAYQQQRTHHSVNRVFSMDKDERVEKQQSNESFTHVPYACTSRCKPLYRYKQCNVFKKCIYSQPSGSFFNVFRRATLPMYQVMNTSIKHKVSKTDVTIGKSFTLQNVFSTEECQELIRRCEGMPGSLLLLVVTQFNNAGVGFELAGLATGIDVYRMRPQTRNNKRVIFDDPKLAQIIFERVKHLLPTEYSGCRVCNYTLICAKKI